ncbi:SHOC1 protein, partial [Centropus unirufus]|nr:SHOC1 protein [Centropus unirufus]
FYSDLCMEEELVFVDNLGSFRKSLPTSLTLLSRLQRFLVKDPLFGHEGQNLTEVNIFRECLTFQNEMDMQESEKELQEIKENFCTTSVQDEEYFMLPVQLEFCGNDRSGSAKIPSHSELRELLNVAPETMADEDVCKEVIKKDVKAEIACRADISDYCPTAQEVCSGDSGIRLELCESDEMEVPFTPPCRQQRSWLHFLCPDLQEEPLPLSGNSILITEPSREYSESLLWQSEKYRDNLESLLLFEHQTDKLTYQHQSLTDLKEMLPFEVEGPVLCPLVEVRWLHLGLNPISIETLEQLNTDTSNANSLLPTEVETFTKFASYQLQSKYLLKEEHQSEGVIKPHASLQTQRPGSTPYVSAAIPAKTHSTNTPVEEFAGGTIERSKVEEAICFLSQEKKPLKSPGSVSCKGVSLKQDNSPQNQRPASFLPTPKWDNDDSDLTNFIMLRSKHTLTQREDKSCVDSPGKEPEEQPTDVHREDSSVCETRRAELRKQESENGVTFNVKASESQCQAFCLLEEAATPVLKDLPDLDVLTFVNWSFPSIKFDHTKFFLKQQEKKICDLFKEGNVDEKEIVLFRHAVLVHLLVTFRDLLLTHDLDTTLVYLSKAKDIYKTILESCLSNIWRQLKIVQYSSQKKHEANAKITELQCQILKWMRSYGEEHSVKILIITRMNSEREKADLINNLSKVEGLKAMDLNSEKKGTCLDCKDIIRGRYSCVIVHNQQIGVDFPWTHFSLVIEYNYSENSCWKNLCKKMNVTYMTFKTTLPETIQMGDHCGSFLLQVQIPYVFLTTEGLLNMPDILQLLESKYSITFVERSSSYSLKLFGSTDQYVVLTIDECTAIFLQGIEQLNDEKSCDDVIVKLVALSLQYSCCWIVFYSRERLSLEYSLRGDTLLNLVLIYAALIELTQKSEDFEVKVVLTPGIEETALVIRQIADNILLASNISPDEWLDKSWLSVLPSETEKCLLAFPCINPLVAQVMLKKESSLNRLFLASFDELQELLPKVPKKVLKHFSDISSTCNVAPPLQTAASAPESGNSFYPD